MNQYKEVLKEVAPGVWTHSHWVDESGNIIVENAIEQQTIEPSTEDLNLAILLDLYAKLEEKGVI